MGVPGPVMPDGYVEVCVNLGWRDLNPQEELSLPFRWNSCKERK